MKITALAGGAGAAKFLKGLQKAASPSDITIIGNTGDDAVIHGLHVSPDLDIVTYTLAGLVGKAGWGFASDTTHVLDQLAIYGVDTWFKLGDRDLATHLIRTQWLAAGLTLSEITGRIAKALEVEALILPMTNSSVRTKLKTAAGAERDFQDYFVRLGHSEQITSVRFEGAADSAPAPGVIDSLLGADCIIVCPSNPVISIGPILAVPGIRSTLAQVREKVVAISPIVAGKALKGPADKLLPLLGVQATCAGVAALYADICTLFVADHRDSMNRQDIENTGLTPIFLETVMGDEAVASDLAAAILSLYP